MLAELSIKNFAIIDSVSISFEDGFTVLTGETGAGKSIIIDAIQLLVGGRGSSDFVRHGTKRAEIEGLFLIDDNPHALEKAREFGIEVEEGMLILHRDIYATGKSVCRINGKLVTISILREIGSTLVDIQGQHEHQELLKPELHIQLLDDFGGEEIARALQEYRSLYREYQKVKKDLQNLTENEQAMAQRLDLLRFQYEEITKADLKIGEDEKLENEKRIYTHFERLYQYLTTAYESLQGEQKGLDWLGLVVSNLEMAAEIDEQYKEMQEQAANSFYILEEISHSLRDYIETLNYNPQRLDEVEARLYEINQLKRKYGQTIDDILAYCAQIEEEIELIENRESNITKLQEKLRSVANDLLVEGEHLSRLRKKVAQKLISTIQEELKALYMDKTVFDIQFKKLPEFTFRPDGIDDVEFYISTNPGEPTKPLAKIASGGELSRIMLALKTIFSRHQGVTSIIFDEVDTGVSGRVAQAIGEKIYQISLHSQVLSITHLPQVAALSDYHYLITKEVHQNRTQTSVHPLSEQERIREIARMIAGAKITDATLDHAQEMLEMAEKRKIVVS